MATSEINSQFADAQSAAEGVINTAQAGAKLPQMLREAVSERFSQSPLLGQRDAAAEQVLTSAPRARADLAQLVQAGAAGQPGGQILSPTQQQSIISARRAADVVPLLSLNDLLQVQTGGVETAVDAGLSGFETLLGAQQARAQLKQSMAESAFERMMAEQEFALKQQEAAKGSGNDSILGSLASILGSLGLGGETGVTGNGETDLATSLANPPAQKPSPDFVARVEQGGNRVQGGPGNSWSYYSEVDDWLPNSPPVGTTAETDSGQVMTWDGSTWRAS